MKNEPYEEQTAPNVRVVTFDGSHNLTEADLVVIQWLSLGKRRWEIAQLIGPNMTKNAVDQRVWNIMNKLGTLTNQDVRQS